MVFFVRRRYEATVQCRRNEATVRSAMASAARHSRPRFPVRIHRKLRSLLDHGERRFFGQRAWRVEGDEGERKRRKEEMGKHAVG